MVENTRKSLFDLLIHIVGVKGKVSRGFYFIVGAVLMAFKYVVEMLVISSVSGLAFTPMDFLVPSMVLRERFFRASPDWLPWALAIWSLPFVWIAVSMTVRRCRDANISQWWGLAILIPLVNLVVMLTMAIMPQREPEIVESPDLSQDEYRDTQEGRQIRMLLSALLGLLIGGLFAVMATAISVYTLESYGASLFMGMPIVSGAAGGFVYNQPSLRGVGSSMIVGLLSCLMGGSFLILFAMEGAVCLIMAIPIVLPLGLFGGWLGYAMAAVLIQQSKWMLGGAILFVFVPLFTLVEKQVFTETPVYVVESSIVVDAPCKEVWHNVIAFPEITAPPKWFFKYGVATPLRARIDGAGVGAVRHCEFTTGSFVEPITVWDQPNRLAFDVTEQPEPLVEMTPYEHIHPPHLKGTFLSVRGEFELVQLSADQTRLIGRTWYTVDMGPRLYWKQWTDFIIHQIHLRVLDHIKMTTE